MAKMRVAVKLSNEEVADMVEQVLRGRVYAYDLLPEYRQGFVDGLDTVVRFLRTLEQASE